MRVQFEYTTKDLADVAERSAQRSVVLRKRRRSAIAGWAALLCFALFFALKGQIWTRLGFASLSFVVLVVAYPYIFPSTMGTTYLKYYREMLGGDGPFVCEVQISSEGIVCRQSGAEIKHPWSSIAEILDTPGGVEFRYRPAGLLVVRDRAFGTPESRAAFTKLARQFAATSDG